MCTAFFTKYGCGHKVSTGFEKCGLGPACGGDGMDEVVRKRRHGRCPGYEWRVNDILTDRSEEKHDEEDLPGVAP